MANYMTCAGIDGRIDLYINTRESEIPWLCLPSIPARPIAWRRRFSRLKASLQPGGARLGALGVREALPARCRERARPRARGRDRGSRPRQELSGRGCAHNAASRSFDHARQGLSGRGRAPCSQLQFRPEFRSEGLEHQRDTFRSGSPRLRGPGSGYLRLRDSGDGSRRKCRKGIFSQRAILKSG